MSSKDKDLYAERTKPAERTNGWAKPTFRTSLGLLMLLVGFASVGFLLYGRVLALIALGYLVILGPLMLLPLLVMWLRVSGKVRPLDLRSPAQAELVQSYFESILRNPGPEPMFYVVRGNDLALYWFQSLNFFSRNQSVFLPETWFHETVKNREQDFAAIWDQMAALTLSERRARSIQFAFWVTAMLPLEVLFRFFQRVIDMAGFGDMPDVSFWSLRAFASLRNLLFGGETAGDPLELMERGAHVRVVRSWASPCLGVWALSPPRYLHPLWSMLAHRDSLLLGRSDASMKHG